MKENRSACDRSPEQIRPPSILDYAAVFDAIPMPATLIDDQEIVVDVNQAFLENARRHGRHIRKEDRIGRPITAFARTEEERRRFSAALEQLWRTRQKQYLHWAYVDPNGRPSHWNIHMQILEDSAGRIAGALILREDVTERVETEQRRSSLNRLRETLWDLSESGDLHRLLQVLQQELRELVPRMEGCSVQVMDEDSGRWDLYQISGDEVSDLMGHVPRPAVVDCWKEQRPVYQPDLDEEDLHGEAASMGAWERTFGHTVRAVLDVPLGQGTLSLYSSRPDSFTERDIEIAQDMAWVLAEGLARLGDLRNLEEQNRFLKSEIERRERLEEEMKRAERVLRESEEQYRRFIEELPIGFACTTPDGRILYHNPHAQAMLGYSPQELSELRAQDLYVRPEDRSDLIRNLAERGEHTYECPVRRKDGRVIWLRGTSRAIRDEQGRIIQYQGFSEDVTARRQMEQEMIHLERLRALGELAAGISHNLNNILTGILAPAQIIRREITDPHFAENLDMILSSAQRASALVERLNQSVRRQSENNLQPVALDEVVRGAIQMTRPRWKDEPESRGVVIEIITHLEEVPPVCGSVSGLQDILVNFLFNAVDALPEGGMITIETRQTGDFVELVFADTGIGMDEETRKRVFEPFFTTKRNVGSGLGLATVYGMVQRLGGRISVQSSPGKGTTFVTQLPICSPQEEGDQGQEKRKPAPSRPGRLLIVEDEDVVRRVLVHLLSRTHQVEVARNGLEALEWFRREQFDVGLVDLGLPDWPGDRVARELKQIDRSAAMVLVTGWSLDEGDPRRAPFDFYLQKPFSDLRLVKDVVARAIRLHDDSRAGEHGE